MIEVNRLIPTLDVGGIPTDQHPGQEAASTAEDSRIHCLIVDDDACAERCCET